MHGDDKEDNGNNFVHFIENKLWMLDADFMVLLIAGIGDVDFITKIPGLVISQFVLLKIANSLRGILLGYLVLNALFPSQRIS